MDQLTKANRVHWYGHVLRKDDGYCVRKAMEYEEDGKRRQDWPILKDVRTCQRSKVEEL